MKTNIFISVHSRPKHDVLGESCQVARVNKHSSHVWAELSWAPISTEGAGGEGCLQSLLGCYRARAGQCVQWGVASGWAGLRLRSAQREALFGPDESYALASSLSAQQKGCQLRVIIIKGKVMWFSLSKSDLNAPLCSVANSPIYAWCHILFCNGREADWKKNTIGRLLRWWYFPRRRN